MKKHVLKTIRRNCMFSVKTFLTCFALFLLTIPVVGQAPEKMSYQAVIRNSNDQLVVNTTVGMRIRIQKMLFAIPPNPPTYEDVYVETQSPETNANGLVTLQIGSGIIEEGAFPEIEWGNGYYFVFTETDPEGGTNYTISGRSQLLSVPYALHAKTADNEKDMSSFITYSVSDFAQGGIVFWVDETGQHGLVCAKEDQYGGSGIQWYNGSYTHTEAQGDGVYAGEMNTMLIIANQGSNSNYYAAGVCANYFVTESGVTYGDWYLPSKEELNLMYQNKATIDATATANSGSGFASDYYWSSSEFYSNVAWYQYFLNGYQNNYYKSSTYRVRAVRAF